jgi:hypothetical protein
MRRFILGRLLGGLPRNGKKHCVVSLGVRICCGADEALSNQATLAKFGGSNVANETFRRDETI